jgi:glycyl-tRNA synthetase (class II)
VVRDDSPALTRGYLPPFTRAVLGTLQVADGTINNQTLAYFMARTAAFLLKAGVKPEGLRFRQHLKTEMAHYACDCWDAGACEPCGVEAAVAVCV